MEQLYNENVFENLYKTSRFPMMDKDVRTF